MVLIILDPEFQYSLLNKEDIARKKSMLLTIKIKAKYCRNKIIFVKLQHPKKVGLDL